MQSKWFKNKKTTQEKTDHKKNLKTCTYLADELIRILEEELEAFSKSTEEDYEKASWPYFRADRDGQERQLRKTLKLMKDIYND